jgi:hypothetical protein
VPSQIPTFDVEFLYRAGHVDASGVDQRVDGLYDGPRRIVLPGKIQGQRPTRALAISLPKHYRYNWEYGSPGIGADNGVWAAPAFLFKARIIHLGDTHPDHFG